MFEILIHLAELLGGVYEVLPNGTVKADDLAGAIASCGALDSSWAAECVTSAFGAW